MAEEKEVKMAEEKEVKPAKVKWTRPSGSKIETNDDSRTIAAAEGMGWKREK